MALAEDRRKNAPEVADSAEQEQLLRLGMAPRVLAAVNYARKVAVPIGKLRRREITVRPPKPQNQPKGSVEGKRRDE
jgi:hypothetical protein